MVKDKFSPLTQPEVRAVMLKKIADSALTEADARLLKFLPLTAADLVRKHPGLTQFPLAGFVLPYFDINGKQTDFFRYRYLEQPQRTGFSSLVDYKDIRYIQPSGAEPRVYFPPSIDWADHFNKAADQRRLIITEGELKSAAAAKVGLPVIGLGGVWNFKGKDSELIQQLEEIPWADMTVFIAFDSDAVNNPQVVQARNTLARVLLARKADIYIVLIPALEPGSKTGLDDYLVSEGAEALVGLIQDSEQWAPSKALHEMNEEVIYVHAHSVYEIATRLKIKPTVFKNEAYVNRFFLETTQSAGPNGVVVEKHTKKSTATEWMKWPARAAAPAYIFEPGKPTFTPQGINEWLGWGVPEEFVCKGDISLWKELLQVQFALEQDRDWFERWAAYPLQHPGTKLLTAVLNWGVKHGSGKDSMITSVKLLHGAHGCTRKERDLDSGFNQSFAQKTLICFEELTGGTSNRRSAGDRFKTLITQTMVKVNEKFIPEYDIKDYAQYYVSSNHADAVHIEPDDRRWFVNEVTNPIQPVEFYTRYWHYFNDERNPEHLKNLGHLLHHLRNLDLGDFDPAAHAPMTKAKQALIALSNSDPARFAIQLRDNPDSLLTEGYTVTKGQQLPKVLNYSLVTLDELRPKFKQFMSEAPAYLKTEKMLLAALTENGINKVNKGEQVRFNRGKSNETKLYLWAVRKIDERTAQTESQLSKIYKEERKGA